MRDVYDSWNKASHHAAATCNDCHVPKDFIGKYMSKGLNGYHHSKAFTLGNFHEPIMIKPGNSKILEENCIRCHQEIVSLVAHDGVLESGEWDCIHCHQSVGHGPRK
jgi:cytochrome c nitrite reductase small subunit